MYRIFMLSYSVLSGSSYMYQKLHNFILINNFDISREMNCFVVNGLILFTYFYVTPYLVHYLFKHTP